MSNYDEIKQTLANQDLKQAMLIAFSNNLEIKLKTSLKKDQNKTIDIISQINLIQGLNTKVDQSLLESEHKYLTEFHQKQLNSVYDTWHKNRETLIKILQLLSGNITDIEINKNLSYSGDDKFDSFDLELITDANKQEKISQDDSQETEKIAEDWIDDIMGEEESEISPNLEFEDFSSAELVEQIGNEEVEIEEESAEEDWSNVDWNEDFANTADIENMMEMAANEESSPSLEVEDNWEEWLDEDSLPNLESDEVTNMNWSQEDWQNANN